MRTTSKARLVFVAVTICATAPPAFAQQSYVEASRNALVRAQPARDAEVRLRLQAGDRLNTVTDQQTNRFYKVFLPNGEVGWVSRYVVRLHRGRGPTLPPPPVVPGVGGGLTTTEREHARFHLLLGKPKGYAEIIREGYVVGYDPRLRIPVWVQYRLTRARSDDNRFPRTDSFEEDGTVPPQARSTLGDYQDSGYARGHMAPAEDMRWSETAEDQSNLLTNIAPQVGSAFNGSVWKTIENRVRGWVIDRRDLTIICGPVFESRSRVFDVERQPQTDRQMVYNVIGENDVGVPTAFFKIIVDMRNLEDPDVVAFLVPHIETEPGPERDIDTHLTNVDRIEELTGLDFLTNLPERVQREVERITLTESW